MPQNRMRHEIKKDQVDCAIGLLRDTLYMRMNQKGNGTFASSHETLGIITEEYHELVQAVTMHGPKKAESIHHELMDIAVACVFGAACIAEGKMDWL